MGVGCGGWKLLNSTGESTVSNCGVTDGCCWARGEEAGLGKNTLVVSG